MKRHYVKHLSQAIDQTEICLNGIIKALGGDPTPPNPKTVVTYQNGTILELDLSGIITKEHFSDKDNIVKIEIGTNINEIGNFFIYNEFPLLKEIVIPTTVTIINSSSFFRGLPIEQQQIFTFLGRLKNDVMSINNYPWEVDNNTIFRCTDGDIIINE